MAPLRVSVGVIAGQELRCWIGGGYGGGGGGRAGDVSDAAATWAAETVSIAGEVIWDAVDQAWAIWFSSVIRDVDAFVSGSGAHRLQREATFAFFVFCCCLVCVSYAFVFFLLYLCLCYFFCLFWF